MIRYNDEYYLLRHGSLCDAFCATKEALTNSNQNESMGTDDIFDETRCIPAEVITKVALADLRFLLEGVTNQQMRKSILMLLCAMHNYSKHHESICYPTFLQSYEDTARPEDWQIILQSLKRTQDRPVQAKVIKAPEGNNDGAAPRRSRRNKFKYSEVSVSSPLPVCCYLN